VGQIDVSEERILTGEGTFEGILVARSLHSRRFD
jgi:hypothetical protein